MTKKPPLGIVPRHLWLKDRIANCIECLQRLQETEDWDLYLLKSLHLANEIKYCAEEWDKYYKNSDVIE